MFFSTRTIAPGNLTFHTARLSVSPRKPFPDENQSEEPSKLPDEPCGPDQGQVESCAANVGRSDAASFTQLKHLPLNPLISFHLFSRRFFTDVRRKQVSLPHTTVAMVTGAGRAISLGRCAPRGRGRGRGRPTSRGNKSEAGKMREPSILTRRRGLLSAFLNI